MQHDKPCPPWATRFIARADWRFAGTYAAFAPHEYTTRWSCRSRKIEDDFTRFCAWIEMEGYGRRWGRHLWPSIDVEGWTFWLYYEYFPPAERTVVNRWHSNQIGTGPGRQHDGQLRMEV
jgi:hypothetical protein